MVMDALMLFDFSRFFISVIGFCEKWDWIPACGTRDLQICHKPFLRTTRFTQIYVVLIQINTQLTIPTHLPALYTCL